MISSTTASTPPPPPPPVSTTVVCSRSTSSRSSAIGNSPCLALLLWRNERTLAKPVPPGGKSMKTQLHVGLALLTLGSCGPRHQAEQPTKNANAPIIPAPSAPPAVPNRPAPAQQAAPPGPTAKVP